MFCIPSKGAWDWEQLLPFPEKQWRTGFADKALATCWEEARGFPGSVREVLKNSRWPALREPDFLLGIPQYPMPLPPYTGTPAPSDLFVLARIAKAHLVVTVQGKVLEPFGPWVMEWLEESLPWKRERVATICRLLEVEEEAVQEIHYRLLDRAAATIVEAKRFNAAAAMLLVHSFSQERRWYNEYALFAKLLCGEVEPDSVASAGERGGMPLYVAWVTGEERYLNR